MLLKNARRLYGKMDYEQCLSSLTAFIVFVGDRQECHRIWIQDTRT